MSHVPCAPSSNWTCGFPASSSPIIFFRRHALAILPDGTPCLPFDTADIGHEESDITIASEQSARGADACGEAINAVRLVQPNPPQVAIPKADALQFSPSIDSSIAVGRDPGYAKVN